MSEKHTPRPQGRGGWWVRTHHDEVRVVQSDTIPNRPEEGEDRIVKCVGPFSDEAKARKLATRIEGQTLSGLAKKRG